MNPGGRLTPASPPLFPAWLDAHLGGATRADMRRCGWGNRGMVVVSKAAILANPKEFYENLLAQLSHDVFPMAGMFMERLWRRVFLCSGWQAGGRGARLGTGGGAAGGGEGRGIASRPLLLPQPARGQGQPSGTWKHPARDENIWP